MRSPCEALPSLIVQPESQKEKHRKACRPQYKNIVLKKPQCSKLENICWTEQIGQKQPPEKETSISAQPLLVCSLSKLDQDYKNKNKTNIKRGRGKNRSPSSEGNH